MDQLQILWYCYIHKCNFRELLKDNNDRQSVWNDQGAAYVTQFNNVELTHCNWGGLFDGSIDCKSVDNMIIWGAKGIYLVIELCII